MRLKPVLAAILTVAAVSAAPQGKAGDHPAIQEYLTHPGFTWICQKNGHFEFCFDPNQKSDPNLKEARKSAEQARTHILRLAGATHYKPLIRVFFLESRARMKELIGYDGEGRARPTQHVVFFVLSPVRPDLTHELCHEIMSNLWGAAETWIEEGLSTYAAEGGFHREIQEWLATEKLLPLADLVNPDWAPTPGSQQFTYSELAGFVEYLKNTYGLQSIRQIWRFGSQGIPGVFGKTLAELEVDWHEALKK